MFKRTLQITLAAILSGSTLLADAATIVDTGSEFDSGSGISVINLPYATQSVGAGFSLAGPYNITDIKSYFYISNPGTLSLTLYSENAGLPGSQLFSEEFSIAGITGTKGWFGVSGLNWSVSSGNYWVTYEISDSQSFDGALQFMATPQDLKMAVKNDYYTNWYPHPGSFGLIVEGTPATAVPEPQIYTMVLVGLGLLGVMVRSRK